MMGDGQKEPQVSKLRRSLSRWASNDEQDARDLRRTHSDERCLPIADAPARERVRVRGTLRTVTLAPRGGVPALEAELVDGTGTLHLVWLGRRRIAGISPGISIQVEGRIGVTPKGRVLYNPRYELRP